MGSKDDDAWAAAAAAAAFPFGFSLVAQVKCRQHGNGRGGGDPVRCGSDWGRMYFAVVTAQSHAISLRAGSMGRQKRLVGYRVRRKIVVVFLLP